MTKPKNRTTPTKPAPMPAPLPPSPPPIDPTQSEHHRRGAVLEEVAALYYDGVPSPDPTGHGWEALMTERAELAAKPRKNLSQRNRDRLNVLNDVYARGVAKARDILILSPAASLRLATVLIGEADRAIFTAPSAKAPQAPAAAD